MKKPLMITAHSGCDNTTDNSIEFVKYALEIGVDAFEIDIRKYGDDLIISHDAPENGDELVYLSEVFARANVKPHVAINCDLKDQNIEQMVLDLAKKCHLKNKIMFSGWVSLEKIKEIERKNLAESYLDAECILENFTEVYLNIECMFEDFYDDKIKNANGKEVSFTDEERDEILKRMLECKAKTLNIHYSCCTKELMEMLAKHDIYISIWTPSTEQELRVLMNEGLRNITTRTPALALKIRDEILGKGASQNV